MEREFFCDNSQPLKKGKLSHHDFHFSRTEKVAETRSEETLIFQLPDEIILKVMKRIPLKK
jgi:hypothetical protein